MGLFVALLALLALVLLAALLRIRRLGRAVSTLQQQVNDLASLRPLPDEAQSATQRYAAPPSSSVSVEPAPSPSPNPAQPWAPPPSPSGYAPPQTSPRLRAPNEPMPERVSGPGEQPSPERPPGPGFIDSVTSRVVGYFTGGNLVVRVGVIVLFFGVAFLLQYANAQGAFDLPIELRLAGVAVLGVALLVTGWLLRRRRRVYGLILQGGGLGITYITVFAALQLYEVLPAGISLPLLVVMVLLGSALAVLQNSSTLMVVAVIGGFLAPLLTSAGEGSHIGLFSYYLVLNVGIVAVAWFRAWRALNLLGFLFTFVIATVWGVLSYTSQDRASTQFFLVIFFLFYVAIAVLYASRQPPRLRGLVDPTLIFGVPLVAFGLQAGLVADTEYGLAISALALGVFYAGLRQRCLTLGGPAYLLLSRTFLALALVFASLSIPFAFDGEWVATAWAIEGAAVLWVALNQRSRLTVIFALALQSLAGVLYLPVGLLERGDAIAVANAVFLGGVLLAAAGLISSWLIRNAVLRLGYAAVWRVASWTLAAWGLAWWLGNGIAEVVVYADGPLVGVLVIVFVAGTTAALGLFEVTLAWDEWRFVSVALLAFAVLAVSLVSISREHLFADGFGWAWLALFTAMYLLLRIRESHRAVPGVLLATLHIGTWWLLAWLLTVEAVWLFERVTDAASEDWPVLGVIVILTPMIWTAMRLPGWPWGAHRSTYLTWGSGVPVTGLVVWSLVAAPAAAADFDPLPYVPFLNPADVAQVIVLATLVVWWKQSQRTAWTHVPRRYGWAAVCVITFVWLTAVLLRTLHHWTGTAYTADALWASDVAQAATSILWTLIALTAMVLATRRGWRRVWVAAVSILGIVVVKLFVVDMRDSDTLGAIIAFIGVGLLLLIAGYLSPLPPRRSIEESEATVEDSSE